MQVKSEKMCDKPTLPNNQYKFYKQILIWFKMIIYANLNGIQKYLTYNILKKKILNKL